MDNVEDMELLKRCYEKIHTLLKFRDRMEIKKEKNEEETQRSELYNINF